MRVLTPYWPSRSLFARDLFEQFEDAFEANRVATYNPRWESSETEEHYLVAVDLPGFKKENLQMEVTEGVLSLAGERQRSDGKQTFEQKFQFPKTVNADGIEAQYEDGVLRLYLPKVAAAKPRKIEIQSQKGGFFDRLLKNSKTAQEGSDTTSHSIQ